MIRTDRAARSESRGLPWLMVFLVVVVGAGPAGLSCAIRLKQLKPDLNICVLEKAASVGAHMLSGAVVEPGPLDALLPGWRDEYKGTSVPAGRDEFSFLTAAKRIRLPTPPQMNTCPAPDLIAPAAWWIACIEEPQNRLMVAPATDCGSSAMRPIRRATFRPCSPSGKAQPMTTSSISAGSRFGVRLSKAWMVVAAISSGRTVASPPRLALPTGVRTALTITASFISYLH